MHEDDSRFLQEVLAKVAEVYGLELPASPLQRERLAEMVDAFGFILAHALDHPELLVSH